MWTGVVRLKGGSTHVCARVKTAHAHKPRPTHPAYSDTYTPPFATYIHAGTSAALCSPSSPLPCASAPAAQCAAAGPCLACHPCRQHPPPPQQHPVARHVCVWGGGGMGRYTRREGRRGGAWLVGCQHVGCASALLDKQTRTGEQHVG